MAYDGLKDLPANLKHIVLLSDGDPARPNRPLLDKIKEAKITITTVCINPHSQRDVQMMEELAQYGGGNFYDVKNNNNLPKIFIKEATIVRRNLILEDPFTPVIRQISEIIQGFESGFPQLDGYVVTGPKTGAETVLITHKKDPLLAHWRFGLGKAVAFTSDAKPRWAKSWIGNEQYNQFWGQLVRWSLRSGQQNSFQVQTALEGDRVKVVVDALTDEGEFVNNLAFAASAIDPGHEARPFEIRQIEPGRYEGSFPADQKGSHLVNMTFKGKDSEDGYLTSGISIPYSPEHNTTRQNDLVLKRLSEISGKPALETEESVFEHDLQSTGDMLALWPILLGLAIALFFCDVAVRRVFFDVPQLQRFFAKAWNWLIYPFVRRTAPVGPATEQLGQLMQAKTRASVDAPMPSEEKEEFLKRLETVKEGDLAELDTLPAEGSKPWQEANVRDEPEKFAETEEEKDAYTSALFRAKLRAKDSIDKR